MSLLRSTRAQAITMLALFLALVGIPLIIGFTGVGLLMLNRARIQDAADSAALAAAREATVSSKFVIRRYDRTCVWDSTKRQTVCSDDPLAESVEITGDIESLLPDHWLKKAGCDGRRQDVHKPGQWKVCEWGGTELQNNSWYLDPQHARSVALQYLSQNLNDNNIKNWRVISFHVDNNLQPPRVRLEIEAQLQNPLIQAIVHKPVNVRVIAWARSVDQTLPIGASQ